MASTAITTFLRVRPAKHSSGYFDLADGAQVDVHVPAESTSGMVNNRRNHWKFKFDGVLDERTTQEETFEQVALPVVETVLEGYNGTIFAYGQTGSGKTFTLTGGVAAYKDRGIIPRALSALFARIDADAEAEMIVHMQDACGAYNRKVYEDT